MGILGGIIPGQNGENSDEVAGQMTSGVAEKGSGPGKIPGKKTAESATTKECQACHQIFSTHGGGASEESRCDRCRSRTEPVHVVHEVEGVDEGDDPENGDDIAEDNAWNKESYSDPGRRHKEADDDLTEEFDARREFVAIVKQAEGKHREGAAEKDD